MCCRLSMRVKAILVSSLRVFSYSQLRCVTHLAYLHTQFMYKLSTVIYSIHFVTPDIFSWRTRKFMLIFVESSEIPSPLFSINALYAFLNSKKCDLVWFRYFSGRKQENCANIWLTSRKSNTVEYNSEYSPKALHDFPWCFIPFYHATLGIRWPGSSVGIATGYGLVDGPGIESRWGARFSAPVQTSPGAHPASCTMGTGSFPGVKSGRGVTLTPHPLLVPFVNKG